MPAMECLTRGSMVSLGAFTRESRESLGAFNGESMVSAAMPPNTFPSCFTYSAAISALPMSASMTSTGAGTGYFLCTSQSSCRLEG